MGQLFFLPSVNQINSDKDLPLLTPFVSHICPPKRRITISAFECKKNNSHETGNQVYLNRTFQIIPEFGICYILQLWTQFVWNNVSHMLRCIIYTLYKHKLIWTTNTITTDFKSWLRMTTPFSFSFKVHDRRKIIKNNKLGPCNPTRSTQTLKKWKNNASNKWRGPINSWHKHQKTRPLINAIK